MPKYMKPGQIAPDSGQAKLVGGNGEITLVKNHRIPPVGKGKGQRIRFVDLTKHKV